jgi:dienelactone hydrolase
MIRRLLDRAGLRLARSIRTPNVDTKTTEVHFYSSAGYRIYGTLTQPTGAGSWPGVVLCPGADHDRRVFDTRASPIRTHDLAALGCAVLSYDPSGRGMSWGPEDFGGPEHQDDAASAIKWLREQDCADATHMGLVGISLGVASAVGAARLLAECSAPVSWLIDWEGPCDQRTITANQTMNAPAMGHKADDRTYWAPREAVLHLPHIGCGYHRIQAQPDHAQPDELGHAMTMVTTAANANLPWFKLNDHHEGEAPPTPRWLAPGPLSANRALLRAVRSAIHRQ